MITFELTTTGKIIVNNNGNLMSFDNNVTIKPHSQYPNYIVITSADDKPFQFDFYSVGNPVAASRDELIEILTNSYFKEFAPPAPEINFPEIQKIQLAHPMSTDAFKRIRVSNPHTLFESHLFQTLKDELWESLTSGSGTIVYLPYESSASLSVTSAVGDKAIREQHGYNYYYPGNSMLVELTAVLGTPASGICRRIGYFSDSDGIFFELNGSNFAVVIRSSATGSVVENRILQQNFNTDKVDGSGPSGKTFDPTKTAIFLIDYQYLGVGTVRFAMQLGNDIVNIHEINHANADDKVYMRSGNAPIRYEIENISASEAATLKQICCTVKAEGGYERTGFIHTANRGIVSKTIAGNTRNSVISIRLKSLVNALANRANLLINNINVYCNNQLIFYELILQQYHLGHVVLNGSPTWNDVSDCSLVEYSLNGTTIGSMGHTLIAGYTDQKNDIAINLLTKLNIALNSAGSASDVVHLMATPIGPAAATVYGSISFGEIY